MGGNISNSKEVIDDLFFSIPLRSISILDIINDFNYEYYQDQISNRKKPNYDIKYNDEDNLETLIKETDKEDLNSQEDEDSVFVKSMLMEDDEEVNTKVKVKEKEKVIENNPTPTPTPDQNSNQAAASLFKPKEVPKPTPVTPTPGVESKKDKKSKIVMKESIKSEKGNEQKTKKQKESSQKTIKTVGSNFDNYSKRVNMNNNKNNGSDTDLYIEKLSETRFQYMYNTFGLKSKYGEVLHLYWNDLYNFMPYEKQVFYTVFVILILSNNGVIEQKKLVDIYVKFFLDNCQQDEKAKLKKKLEATIEDLFELIYHYVYSISFLCIDKVKYYTLDPNNFKNQLSKIWDPEIIKSFCKGFFDKESKWHTRIDVRKFFEENLPILSDDAKIRHSLTEFGKNTLKMEKEIGYKFKQ